MTVDNLHMEKPRICVTEPLFKQILDIFELTLVSGISLFENIKGKS